MEPKDSMWWQREFSRIEHSSAVLNRAREERKQPDIVKPVGPNATFAQLCYAGHKPDIMMIVAQTTIERVIETHKRASADV